MKNIQSLIITAVFLMVTTTVYADKVTDVLSGKDKGFGYSVLHHATGCNSMCGGIFSGLSLSTDPNHHSYFHANDFSSTENFKLYLTLDDYNNSLLTLRGMLDFRVATGELLGKISADFEDNAVHGDTFFKFVQGTVNAGGNNVPKPNGIRGDLLSLWGANSNADPLNNSIGFNSNTASLGIDLVVRWEEPTPPNEISEPASLLLFAFGLLGLGAARLRK